MSTLLRCLLEPATGFTGSSMTMALSACLGCASMLTSQSSRVYCSNVLLDDAVFGSTILAGRGGGCMTCLVAAHFAASFHIMPLIAFSDHCLANGLITSETHWEVRPACLLSHWWTSISSSVPLFHWGYAVGALNHIQPPLLFGILYWFSVNISYVPGALNISQNLILKPWAMPFGVTFQDRKSVV